MALTFHKRTVPSPSRVALFPGAYNPPTVAHLAVARAALDWSDEVVWVLPQRFPHKPFEVTTFEQRIDMLQLLVADEPGFSLASSEAGLYAGIADEAREFYGAEPEIGLVCGRDAARRIATWDYGTPGFFEAMLERYRLMVAARNGEYQPEAHHRHRIVSLTMPANYDDVSSTEIRERLLRDGDWRSLVPDAIAAEVERLYTIASRRPARDRD